MEGQMQGGTVQGIGWALNEEYFFTADGTLANGSFLDYRMPTPVDVPMTETVILQRHRHGPLVLRTAITTPVWRGACS